MHTGSSIYGLAEWRDDRRATDNTQDIERRRNRNVWLYKDSDRTQPWGDSSTPGSTVAGTGNGVMQNFTVFGRVPPQTTPSAGVYT
ncbi:MULTISPECIES: spore coat protein U domain-containing protein [unclassified Mesorhizobium]|uniref:spore coat protein U domain-containing protein n=1 Tax=unclassified Mesorhizobium TaxID=325217 RepID=UPI00333DA91F